MTGAVPAELAEIRRVAARSGSSFYWAMRLLPGDRRDAIFAVYAFCRDVDDIADGPLPAVEKQERLAQWRTEIGRVFDGEPRSATGRALAEAARRFGLARADMEAVVDGVAMDADASANAPDMATLELYCSRVAGAVGLLAIRIFGDSSEPARRGALALGHALQLTNILRDVAEDAERGRLYLPRELLAAHGLATQGPATVLRDPALAGVCRDLAALAERRFAEAGAAFAGCDRRALGPAFAMMEVYRLLLRRMQARGWDRPEERPRIGTAAKLRIALKYLLPGVR